MIQPPGLGTPRPLYCDFDIQISTSAPASTTNALTLVWWGCPNDPLRNDYATNPFYYPSPPDTVENVWPGSDVFLSLFSDSTHIFWIEMTSMVGNSPLYYISNDNRALKYQEFLGPTLSPNDPIGGSYETTFLDGPMRTVSSYSDYNVYDMPRKPKSFPESAWDTGSDNLNGFKINALTGCKYVQNPAFVNYWRVYIW